MNKNCAIILNGIEVVNNVAEDYIICADGGYRLLKDRIPDIVIGDFDSLTYPPTHIPCIKHSVIKNKTDGELCVDYAKDKGFDTIVFYGALGGRIDQVFGNVNLLGYCLENNVFAHIVDNDVKIYLCDSFLTFDTKVGKYISILPIGGDAIVEETSKMAYPIKNLEFKLFSSLGISNKSLSDIFSIKMKSGKCLIIEGCHDTVR